MPYEETGKEKAKRIAWENKNKQEKGVEFEKKRDYKLFGTTEQNIPSVNPMGDVVTPAATGMKKGGAVKCRDGIATKGKTKGRMV